MFTNSVSPSPYRNDALTYYHGWTAPVSGRGNPYRAGVTNHKRDAVRYREIERAQKEIRELERFCPHQSFTLV